MIRVLSKVAYRFTNHTREGSISKPKPRETPEEASKRAARDAAVAMSNATSIEKHREHYFDVKPGEVTDCPDWVRKDDIFAWGLKDGNLMELVPHSAAAVAPEAMEQLQGETVISVSPVAPAPATPTFNMGLPAERAGFLAEATDWRPEEKTEETTPPEEKAEEEIPTKSEEIKEENVEDGNLAGAEQPGTVGGPIRRRKLVGIGKK